MRLSQVDLNLFVVFDTVYTERNLTRAAEVLCITQPAVSNALVRLRKTFDDELFIRTPQGMVPTPVAESMAGQVRDALHLLHDSVQEGSRFDPSNSDKVFKFSMNDLAETLVLPSLLDAMQRVAPNISLENYFTPRKEVALGLSSGSLDFAIDVPLIDDSQLVHCSLNKEPYVCAVRRDHPKVENSISLKRYLSLGHIHISSRRRGLGHVDLALQALGKKRRIQVRGQHYRVGPAAVMRSDLVMTCPKSLAEQYDVKILPLPFEVPELEWHLYWHKSVDRDPACVWMRQCLMEISG